MKRMLRKQMMASLLMLLAMVLAAAPALAAATGGTVIDVLIPRFELIANDLPDLYTKDSFSISEEQVLGKAGTIFIDLDDGEIRMVGDNLYRTYSFTDTDGTAFIAFIGVVLYGVDSSGATDYGVNVYYTEHNDTKALSPSEISTLSAQFISALN